MMPEKNVTLSQAPQVKIQHCQTGRLNEAEQLFARILSADPNHTDGLNLMRLTADPTARSTGSSDFAFSSLPNSRAKNPIRAILLPASRGRQTKT